jgi:hypothetical protein
MVEKKFIVNLIVRKVNIVGQTDNLLKGTKHLKRESMKDNFLLCQWQKTVIRLTCGIGL